MVKKPGKVLCYVLVGYFAGNLVPRAFSSTIFKMADRRKKRPGLLPTIRHFENRRRGGPGDEVDIAGWLCRKPGTIQRVVFNIKQKT